MLPRKAAARTSPIPPEGLQMKPTRDQRGILAEGRLQSGGSACVSAAAQQTGGQIASAAFGFLPYL